MSQSFPRVTEILRDVGLDPDYSMVPPDVLAAAQERGTAVHRAIEAITYGYFDQAEFPLEITPYLDAYRRFVAESGYVAQVAEIEVVHDVWRYRGHVDSVGILTVGSSALRTVIDWKAVAAVNRKAVGFQLAAYFEAWNRSRPTEQVQTAAAVQLRGDGTYAFLEANIAESRSGWQAAVTVWWRLYEHRRARA